MSTIKLTFLNNSGVGADDIHIGFVSGSDSAPFDVALPGSGTPLCPVDTDYINAPVPGNWYRLSDLPDGVDVTSFSGRVYVCYGTPWSVQRKGYEPGQTPVDDNFYLRYDKMEMTFTGAAADVANLTSIDYWAIPMSLRTYKGGEFKQSVAGLLPGKTAGDIYDALRALTTPPVSGIPGPGANDPLPNDSVPLPALVPGRYIKFPGGPEPLDTFARIIGPSSYPAIFPDAGIPVAPYDTLEAYLMWLREAFGPGTRVGASLPKLGDGVFAIIAGHFAGVGPDVPTSGPKSPQAYFYAATIRNNLDIELVEATPVGTGGFAAKEDGNKILYKREDLLNPSGIYGGNTPFYLNGSNSAVTPQNDVYGWIGGDLFSGFNIGAVGSGTDWEGTLVGALQSHAWFCLPLSKFFSGLQPQQKFYNQWAATLATLSEAYNFAYSDRFAPVFVSLDADRMDTLAIVLEQATVGGP